jgi:hypothetical protein
MAKDDKKMGATEDPQAVSNMEDDERAMELETIKLAREIVEIRYRADLPLDVCFVAQVPFIIGGIG